MNDSGGGLTTYTYNAANAQILAVASTGVTTTSYDAVGNMYGDNEAGAITTYTFNPDNRLTLITFSNGTTNSHLYDAAGYRQQSPVGAELAYIWDLQNVIIRANLSGVTQEKYTEGPGTWGLFSQLGTSAAGAGYPVSDMSGNVRLIVSANGDTVTDTIDYHAFGAEFGVTGSTEAFHRFGGQFGYWRDGTYRRYVRQRWMLSDKGVWNSRDRIGFAGGLNLYKYAANNPVVYADPSGLLVGPPGVTVGIGIWGGVVTGAIITATAPEVVAVGVIIFAGIGVGALLGAGWQYVIGGNRTDVLQGLGLGAVGGLIGAGGWSIYKGLGGYWGGGGGEGGEPVPPDKIWPPPPNTGGQPTNTVSFPTVCKISI